MRTAIRKRLPLIILALLLLALLFSQRAAVFATDLWWFREVGASSVFTTSLFARLGLGAMGAVTVAAIVAANLVLVRRLRPTVIPNSPQQAIIEQYRNQAEPYFKWIIAARCHRVRADVGGGAGLRVAHLPAVAQRRAIRALDPQFGRDVGFYVFDLPWWQAMQSWGVTTMVLVGFLCIGGHLLLGGIRPDAPRDRVLPQVRDPPALDPGRDPGAAGVGLLARPLPVELLAAWHRDRCVLHRRERGTAGAVPPAGRHGRGHRAGRLGTRGRVVPLPGAPWAAGGRVDLAAGRLSGGDPAAARGAAGTGSGTALHRAQPRDDPGCLRPDGLGPASRSRSRTTSTRADRGERGHVRQHPAVGSRSCWQDNYQELQALRPYYQFNDVDMDRYPINGELRQVMLSTRELDRDGLPEPVAERAPDVHPRLRGRGQPGQHGDAATASRCSWRGTSRHGTNPALAPDGELVPRPGLYFGERGYPTTPSSTPTSPSWTTRSRRPRSRSTPATTVPAASTRRVPAASSPSRCASATPTSCCRTCSPTTRG